MRKDELDRQREFRARVEQDAVVLAPFRDPEYDQEAHEYERRYNPSKHYTCDACGVSAVKVNVREGAAKRVTVPHRPNCARWRYIEIHWPNLAARILEDLTP